MDEVYLLRHCMYSTEVLVFQFYYCERCTEKEWGHKLSQFLNLT